MTSSVKAVGASSTRVPERRISPAEAVNHFEEVLLGYDPHAAAQEAKRGLGLSFEAGTEGCPFGVDIDALVATVAAGDFDAAADVVRQAHPWGGILGRMCHRFCEQSMKSRYPEGTEPLNLRGLERAAADHGRYHPIAVETPPSGKHVVVVGAGSGGVGAALALLQAGHEVSVIDAMPETGGMFRVGYPTFRMPRPLLDRELAIDSPRLHMEMRQRVDRQGLEALLREYDAVCLAIGRFRPSSVKLPGDDLVGVYEALDFLERKSYGPSAEVGQTVAVLGAGYTAQDVARTARRLGATVHVLYRRGPDEMPVRAANRRKFIRMMESEGIPYQFLVNPVRIVGEAGRVVAVECQRMCLGEPDASGRRQPLPADEPPYLLPVDTVIKAFGQQPDLSILPESVRVDGYFVANVRYHSSQPGLFVVGDIAGNVGNDGAFLGGIEAATHIGRYMTDPTYEWPSIPPELRMEARRPGAALGGG